MSTVAWAGRRSVGLPIARMRVAMCPNGRLTEGETGEFDRCKFFDIDMDKWAAELAY